MNLKGAVQVILEQYSLPYFGVHGVSHWARVLQNGIRLAAVTGANKKIVQLFAIFHDAKRINESVDFLHGQRGADFALLQRGRLFDLTDEEFDLLHTACSHHTDGMIDGDITVVTCWDADRLDLARSGIKPIPSRLCTEAAKDPEIIAWANQRSLERFVPELVQLEWGVILD
jgi:uncharacterized protein